MLFALFAGFMGCAFGGFMLGVASETTFGLVAPLMCEDGQELQVECYQRSYHQPGECEPDITCVGPAGEENVTGTAIFTVLLSFFACAFVPIALVLGALGWIVPGKIVSAIRRKKS